MLDVVSQWVSHYGYVLVAVFLLVEAAGVPVPGETALVTAAALAGRGTLSLVWVILSGCAGTIVGGHLGYWIGQRGGHALVHRHGKWIGLTEKRLAKTHEFFAEHGAKTVLLGRFVAFIRSFVGIFAGVSEMSLPVFATYNAAGGAIWAAAFSVLGYMFGKNLPRLVHYIGRVSLLLAIFIALVVGVVLLWRWFGMHRGEVVASLDETFERHAATPRMSGIRTRHPVAWRFFSGRFAQSEYLAMHLAVGFVVSLAVIGVFASITEGLVDSSPLTRFDVVVADRLRQSLAPEAIRIFSFLSSLGGRGAMTLLLFAGGVFYAIRREGITLIGWCAAFIGGSLLDASLRFVVRRSELPFADVVLVGWGTGLASGHALGVAVGFGMLAYFVCKFVRNPAGRTLVIVAVAALVAAITVSRLYLGQAYISDASAGLAAGLLWLTTCISGIEIARQRHWTR
ncbi:MAG TPA: VTT domain-containing protein [Gemmatimonadaceae bacterium]|jgi:membrane protein DedA with SNARE-associated domain/membrane-associated phospholipid phosphatase